MSCNMQQNKIRIYNMYVEREREIINQNYFRINMVLNKFIIQTINMLCFLFKMKQ